MWAASLRQAILLPPPGAEDEREGDRGETERETAEERLCERVRGRIIFGIFFILTLYFFYI
jgi:hypothetical protein